MTLTTEPVTTAPLAPLPSSSSGRSGVPRADGFRLTDGSDPDARKLENRGRLWIVVAYVLCPCHLPVTLSLLAMTLGGTTLGGVIATNAWPVGIALGTLSTLAVWRAFRHLRRAQAAGDCGTGACNL